MWDSSVTTATFSNLQLLSLKIYLQHLARLPIRHGKNHMNCLINILQELAFDDLSLIVTSEEDYRRSVILSIHDFLAGISTHIEQTAEGIRLTGRYINVGSRVRSVISELRLSKNNT
jgi:hypothetical protein